MEDAGEFGFHDFGWCPILRLLNLGVLQAGLLLASVVVEE